MVFNKDYFETGVIELELKKYTVIKSFYINGRAAHADKYNYPDASNALIVPDLYDDHIQAYLPDLIIETYGRIVYDSTSGFRIIPSSGYKLKSQTFTDNVLTLEIE